MTTRSIRLVRELIVAGLVEEYRLFIYPVVLGRGQQLFANASAVLRLRLVESQPFRSGHRAPALPDTLKGAARTSKTARQSRA